MDKSSRRFIYGHSRCATHSIIGGYYRSKINVSDYSITGNADIEYVRSYICRETTSRIKTKSTTFGRFHSCILMSSK